MLRITNLPLLALAPFTIFVTASCEQEIPNSVSRADGTEIFFDTKGSGAPALVFIHGWCNDKSVWRDQVDHFSKKYKVVAIDLPGSGASVSDRKDWTVGAFADDVRAVIDVLDLDDVVLVGFSLGGFIAVEAAAKHPDGIRGIVLADEMRDLDVEFTPAQIALMDSLFRDVVRNPSDEVLVATGFYRSSTDSALVRVQGMMTNISIPTWDKSLPNIFEWIGNESRGKLSQISLPVRSIVSDFRPTNVEAMGKYLDDFEYWIIPNTSHLIMWDDPDAFNTRLEAVISSFPEN